jgi:hypothetical protein
MRSLFLRGPVWNQGSREGKNFSGVLFGKKRIRLAAIKELLGSMLAAQLVAVHEDLQFGGE